MHRRLILTGLVALTAVPAIAQNRQGTPMDATPAPTGTQAGGAAGGVYQGGAVGQAGRQHIQQTMAAGTVALQTSEIALQKAQNARVKQFAQFERDEQTTLAEVMRSMQEPAATGSTTTAPEIPADKAAMMDRLQQAKAGAEFDRMYVEGQIQGHQELMQIQERYLSSAGGSQGGMDREHVNVAKLARGHIKEHLVMLQEIQQQLRG